MILSYSKLAMGIILLFSTFSLKTEVATAECEVQIGTYDLLSAIKNDIIPIEDVLIKTKPNDLSKWNNKGVTDSTGELVFKLSFDEKGELLYRFMAQRSGYEVTTKLIFLGQYLNSDLPIQYFLLKEEDKEELASLIRADITAGLYEEALDKINIVENAYPELDSVKFIEIIQLKEEVEGLLIPTSPSIYVWEFATRDGKKNETTVLLTAEVEKALIQSQCCSVLQRRRFARLFDQPINAPAFMSTKDISSPILDDLKSLEANTIVWGEISEDVQLGQVKITVNVDFFEGQVFKKRSVYLPKHELDNPAKRAEAIAKLITSLNLTSPGAQASPVDRGRAVTFGDWEFTLLDCKRIENEVICRFTITSHYRDRRVILSASSPSKSLAYDDFGYEYEAQSAQLANQVDRKAVKTILIAEVPMQGKLVFTNISPHATKFTLLEISVRNEEQAFDKIQFRDLSIK